MLDVVIACEDKVLNATAEELLGRYNDAPPNLKEITQKEFNRQLMTYGPSYMDHKQVLNHPKYRYMSMSLFIYNDFNGIAMADVLEDGSHDYKTRYFKFAVCEHEMISVPEKSAMCYHVSRCKKCGKETAIDSSG